MDQPAFQDPKKTASEYAFLRVEPVGIVDPKWRYRITRPELAVSADIYPRGAEAEEAGAQWLAQLGYSEAGHIYPNAWRKPRTDSVDLARAARQVLNESTPDCPPSLGSLERLRAAVEDFDGF